MAYATVIGEIPQSQFKNIWDIGASFNLQNHDDLMKQLTLLITLLSSTLPAFADHPSIGFGQASSGPIATLTASTLKAGKWSAGIKTEIIENDAFSERELVNFAAQGKEGVHSVEQLISTSLSFAYGITDDFTLSAQLPYIERQNIRESELEDGEPEAHVHGDSSGFGDLSLLGQYRLFDSENTDFAIQLGLKAPTGETHDNDQNGERFETEFQPGSGSWDFLAGVAISSTFERIGIHANILLNKTTEGAQQTEIGDALSYNLAMTYRLNADHHHLNPQQTHTDITWDAIVELNGETRRRNEIAGVKDQNSGGTTLFLSPGLRLNAGSFGGYVSIGIPIIENTYGTQTDISARVIAGFSFAL